MKKFLFYFFCLLFLTHTSWAQIAKNIFKNPYIKVIKTNNPKAPSIVKGSVVAINIKQYLDTFLVRDNGKQIVSQKDLGEDFLNMKEGDNIFLAVPVSAFVKDTMEYNNFITRIELVKVFNNISVVDSSLLFMRHMDKRVNEEDSKISQFLKDRDVQATKLPNGVYLEVSEPGNGNVVGKNKPVQISVRYRGILMDNGLVFHQNMKPNQKPLVYTTDNYEFLPVCEEVLKTMKKGAHVRLYIPSHLAFGKRSISNILPPYSNLIYEFLLEDIQPISKVKNKKKIN